MDKVKAFIISIVSLLMIGAVAAPEPRHPLSQIYPTDTDLNMSDYEIKNVSRITLNLASDVTQTGLVLDDYRITHEGDAQRLVLDYQNDQWDIINSDLNMNNNDILNVENLEGDINISGNLSMEDNSINNISSLDGGGDEIDIFDTLDFNGNAVRDSEGPLEFETELYLPNDDLDMAGNNIINPGEVDGVDLDNPGNGLGRSNSRYQIIENAIGNSELNNSQSFTVDGLTLNDNIDLGGNNITDIDTLHFETGMQINGSINTSGGNANFDGGNINDVSSIDGGGDAVRFDDDIDMDENDLVNVEGLQDNDGTNTIQFDGSNNVEVPNGNLEVGSNINNPELTLDAASGNQGSLIFEDSDSRDAGIEYETSNDRLVIKDRQGTNADILRLSTGNNQNVRLPNGNLDLKQSGDRGNNITNVNTISGRDTLNLQGQGASQGVILEQGDGTDILEAGTGDDNVDIPNGNLDVSSGGIRLSNSYAITSSTTGGDITFGSGTTNVLIRDKDDLNSIRVNDGGNVGIPNGNLQLQGNSIIDASSSNSVPIGDGSDDSVSVDAGGSGSFTVNTGDTSGGSTERLQVTANSGDADIDVSNADLDMNDNSIVNHYGDQCPQQYTVVDVYNNGSFKCVNIADEVMDEFVNESGDLMTGELDMGGNDIYNVSDVGIGNDNPQQNLDVDGDAEIESGGTKMRVSSSGDVVVTLGG